MSVFWHFCVLLFHIQTVLTVIDVRLLEVTVAGMHLSHSHIHTHPLENMLFPYKVNKLDLRAGGDGVTSCNMVDVTACVGIHTHNQ